MHVLVHPLFHLQGREVPILTRTDCAADGTGEETAARRGDYAAATRPSASSSAAMPRAIRSAMAITGS